MKRAARTRCACVPAPGLPNAAAKGLVGKYFLLRTKGTQGHEVYDVTNPANPILVFMPIDGQTDTHKNWWKRHTGIAYLVGCCPGWRTGRMTQVFELERPVSSGVPFQTSACPRSSREQPARSKSNCTDRTGLATVFVPGPGQRRQ